MQTYVILNVNVNNLIQTSANENSVPSHLLLHIEAPYIEPVPPRQNHTMIHSVFAVNAGGDIFLEKHWRSVVSRSVCDYFLEAQRSQPTDIPPVISTPHYYLISIERGSGAGVHLVAACKHETQPLFVIEFLHRVVDTFEDYFGECTETVIKDNYVVVYELLDEMLDNGFPLATESNILKELIRPPNILRTIANSVTGKSK